MPMSILKLCFSGIKKSSQFCSRFIPETGFVLCAGSKNVHMIVRNHSDVAKYNDSRFLVAR
jgi:hypothetical protein